ncbi:hypothetical protein UFOVP449_151 [uncultured Caudovirales phage]|uniref:Uncharacterized protein n=1 Tax=uncultured Caudovirales phage TaxID=2100421 RepID=A0A6J5MAR4_9CAUD|nr:hypothetical protein UFOVP449_151 [uncultured Caudovirales phage]
MKSDIVKRLIEVCGLDSDPNMAFGIKNLSAEQLTKVQDILKQYYGFKQIVWVDLPTFVAEDATTCVVKPHRITDELEPVDTYKDAVAYFYSIVFTPKMYKPEEIYQPVKDGCVLSPIIYDPTTFLPKRSITIEWCPEFPVDLENPMTWEDEKKMIHDKLEMVLENAEDYMPAGYIGGILRFAVK